MPQKYQPLSLRRRLQSRIQERKDAQDPALNPLAKAGGLHNWQAEQKRIKVDEAQLESITPPKVKDSERKALQLRRKQLEEAYALGKPAANIPPVPSNFAMQDNTDGSTDDHLTHSIHWKNFTLDENGKQAPAKEHYGLCWELKDINLRFLRTDGREETSPSGGSLEYLRSGHRVPLAENHATVQFEMPNLDQKGYDKAFPDHVPLPNEIQAGIYHKECKMCGEASVDKHTPYCARHQSVEGWETREAVTA